MVVKRRETYSLRQPSLRVVSLPMVVKPTSVSNFSFESSVISYGSKTFCQVVTLKEAFESSVISYGSKTKLFFQRLSH